MNQNEIFKSCPLLDDNGHLVEPGFAKHPYWMYSRKAVTASKLRIKEWDYYYIINDDFALALTIADNSYMGLDSISFIDFRDKPWEHTLSPMQFFTLGRKLFPNSPEGGSVSSAGKNHSISFRKYGDVKKLTFNFKNFMGKSGIEGEIILTLPETESMVIATPFREDPKAFYYNTKVNCMPAEGYVKIGSVKYEFSKGTSWAGLDWGRGVWTYKNTWYWGSCSSSVDGVPFGFNIGYGFGDTSAATENMIFYNNRAHKLSDVRFNIPFSDGHEDYMSPWTFTSDDGRFEMDFIPIIDRAAKTDFKILCSDQHQVFGRYTGKAVLDDGTVIEIKDMIGFAEKVFNKW